MSDSWHSSHAMESHIGRLEAELRRARGIIRKLANLAEKHGHKDEIPVLRVRERMGFFLTKVKP